LPDDAGVADASMDPTVAVHLVLHGVNPVTGKARIDGTAGESRFCGWIALMAIINEACSDLSGPPPAEDP
jgi:hypothetical protein